MSGRSRRRRTQSPTSDVPQSLVERAILCGSREGDTVLDPFAGSGTVGLVAQALNRRAILMDVLDSYVALMKGRDAA